MKNQNNSDQYSNKEAAKRAEDTIRRMFAMPHTLQRDLKGVAGPRGEAQRKRRAKARRKS